MTNGTSNRTVVEVNEGGQQPKKNAVLGLKEKKIDNDRRTTTPYMTKYERARVLGTRALQIRYANYQTKPMRVLHVYTRIDKSLLSWLGIRLLLMARIVA